MNQEPKRLIAARIAALLFLIWGLLHVAGGLTMLLAANTSVDAYLQLLSDGAEASGIENVAIGKVFAFHAFNLLWMGALCIWIVWRFNWRNRPEGLWLNLMLIGLADAGLLLFMVGSGVMPIANAWLGPALLLLALGAVLVSRWRKEPVGA
ncbi:MAG: hypothetical protein K1X75_10375 [Leptospirales bacterium]|nr:hypothetical protein [Leptospirales bacterium]